jgi:hypothetical protein
MRRPDGKFVILAGATSTAFGNAQLYDPETETITRMSATTTAPIGLGALAFKRPDGKFLIVLGNSTGVATTTTNIYDPTDDTFSYGPPLTGPAGRGALVIPLPTGKFLIVHGNYQFGTSIYDPFQNNMIQGPLTVNAAGGGSLALPRPDGTYLFIPGTSNEACTLVTATNIFDPRTMTFRANPNTTITTGTGPGAFAFQREDGVYMIIKGGATATTCAFVGTTNLYNPLTNRMIVGPAMSATLPLGLKAEGGFAMPGADGSWYVMVGSASTTKYQIYLEKGGVEQGSTEDFPSGGAQGFFLPGPTGVGPTAVATSTMQPVQPNTVNRVYLGVGPGAIGFQRPDGKFFILAGSASSTATSTVTAKFDAGWVSSGMYRTEQINITDLDSNSVLNWKVSPSFAGISAEVKTAPTQQALQTAAARPLTAPGQKINPDPGDVWLQVTFNFKRDFPSYTGVYTDVWYNGSTPVATQRKVTSPVLTEISVTKDVDFMNLQADGLTMLLRRCGRFLGKLRRLQ